MPTAVTGKWDTNDQIAFFFNFFIFIFIFFGGVYFTIFMAGRGDL